MLVAGLLVVPGAGLWAPLGEAAPPAGVFARDGSRDERWLISSLPKFVRAVTARSPLLTPLPFGEL